MFVARTRFSLFIPQSNGWKLSRANTTSTEYKDQLFEESRLNFRIRFLSDITLPTLERACVGYDFLHVIEYSSCLPKKYILILKNLEVKYKFLQLNEYNEDGSPERKLNAIIIDYFDLKNKQVDAFIGRFVLDDDDCISLNYFNVMKEYLSKPFEHFYISIGLGVVGVFDENNNILNCAEMYKPKINIGFMNVGRYSFQDKKLYFSEKSSAHMNMDKVNRVVLDSRKIGFYWSRHYSQDTRLDKPEKKLEVMMNSLINLPALDEEKLNHHFGPEFHLKLKSLSSS